MSDLADLMDAARAADAATRINHRNDIARHGRGAIGPMLLWLRDPALGGFAVRVLSRIANDPGLSADVLTALSTADRTDVPTHVCRDLDAAVAALRPAPAPTIRARASGPKAWPVDRGRVLPADATAEERFNQAMLDIYWLAGESTGYWASYFLRGVRNKGGLAEAHDLLLMSGTSKGFERLTEMRRLDLSMEALVLRPEFESLFSAEERATALRRLLNAGYDPNDS